MLHQDSATSVSPSAIVVMGVAGCGKSSVAVVLCHRLGWTMIEGDEYHSAENRTRMHAGVALTDDDRAGWLDTLGQVLHERGGGMALTCSALKRRYRDTLRAASPGLRFVFLDIDRAESLRRVSGRAGDHFFNPDLVDSQFEALERPDGEAGVLRVDATLHIDELCDAVITWLSEGKAELQPNVKDNT